MPTGRLSTIVLIVLAILAGSICVAAQAETITVSLETVDTSGQPLAGQVLRLSYSGWEDSPYTFETSNGATNGVFYARYARRELSYQFAGVPLLRDHTYQIDSLTGVMTDVPSPGQTRIQFVFDLVDIALETVDTTGQPLAGQVLVLSYSGWEASPYTFELLNGTTNVTFYGRYARLEASYQFGALPVLRDHTYRIDPLTREMTDLPTPGQTKVQFVFDLVDIVTETVDTAGQPLAGEVHVEYFTDWVDSPYAFQSPNGATIGVVIARYARLQSHRYFSHVPLLQGHTYRVDALTQEMTDLPTPGQTKIQFVFDPVDITTETIDTNGQPLAGLVNVEYYSGWVDSPYTFELSSGASIGVVEGYYARLTRYYRFRDIPLFRDHTYQVDALTGVMTDLPTPGQTKIQFVFDPVDITTETIDTNGQPLAGLVNVEYYSGWVDSPYTFELSSGASIGVVEGYYARLTRYYRFRDIPLFRDHTYQVDALTGVMTDLPTPGQTKIQFVFDPVDITTETIGTAGQPLAGHVNVEYYSAWENSPYTFELSSGASIGMVHGLHDGVVSYYSLRGLPLCRDHTYRIDALTREMTDLPTPGETRIQFQFPIEPEDDVGPLTTIDLSGQMGDNGWFVGDVTVNIAATDLPDPGGVGVAEIHYQLDEEPEQVVTVDPPTMAAGTSFVVCAEGTHALTAWAVDALGNTGAPAVASAPNDGTPPSVSAEPEGTQGGGGYYTSDVRVVCTGDDGGGSGVHHVEYTFDCENGPWQTASEGGVVVTGEGEHTICLRAVDNAGNVGTVVTVVFRIDKTSPVLALPDDIVVEQASADGAIATFTVTATDNLDPNPVATADPPSGSTFPLGATTVTCTATDDAGHEATGTFTVTVVDTTPPVLTVSGDITVEQATADGTVVEWQCEATDICDADVGMVCVPSSGSVFPLGATTVTCTATDESGNVTTGTFTVTVVDTTKPDLSLNILKETLWPPNHKMHLCATVGGVSDVCDADPDVEIVVTSNEPINAKGDGNTDYDWEVVDNDDSTFDVYLRAERQGSNTGRIYTITVTVTDDSGNVTETSATVTVPHDQGNGKGKK